MNHRATTALAPVLTAAIALALGLGSTAARAENYPAERATGPAPYARVLSVTPNVERYVDTRAQCTDQIQQVTTQGSGSLGGTVVGALIGGAAGSAIGKGHGRTLAAATGAAIGAQMGRSYTEQPTTTTRVVQVCQPVSTTREQVRDYSVRYEWEGREYLVNLAQHPGTWLRVNAHHTVQTM